MHGRQFHFTWVKTGITLTWGVIGSVNESNSNNGACGRHRGVINRRFWSPLLQVEGPPRIKTKD